MQARYLCLFVPVVSLTVPAAAGSQVPGMLHAGHYTRPGTVEFEGGVEFSYFHGACYVLDRGSGDEEPVIRKGSQDLYRLRLSPGFGFFALRGLQVGLRPIFSYSQQVHEGPEGLEPAGSKELGGGAEVFLRYVIGTKSSVFPFIGFSLGGGGGITDDVLGERDFNFIDAGPQMGIKVLLGRRGILTLSFNYWFESYESGAWKGREPRHLISFAAGLGFWLGDGGV